jgi:hypothetical protein
LLLLPGRRQCPALPKVRSLRNFRSSKGVLRDVAFSCRHGCAAVVGGISAENFEDDEEQEDLEDEMDDEEEKQIEEDAAASLPQRESSSVGDFQIIAMDAIQVRDCVGYV